MGIIEAKKYIHELHKKQDNPFLWPDFLTGLPGKAAIIKKIDEAFPILGRYSIAIVRIANINSYLIKYGPDRHAEIIQWATAILRTSGERSKNFFVGTLSTHDFIVICRTRDMEKIIREGMQIFRESMAKFYTKADLKNKTTLSFDNSGEKVNIGLMKLVAVIADHKLETEKSLLIQCMSRVCDGIEGSGDDLISMSNNLICESP